MRVLLLFSLFLAFVSCSSSHKKNEKEPEVKKEEVPVQVTTLKPTSLSPDELKRLELLEHYRKLREENFKIKKESPKIKKAQKNITIKHKEKVEKKVESSVTPSKGSSDELRIQLDQHMAYYCIQFESRFSNASDCRAHTENVLKSCQDKKAGNPSLNLIQCLKKNM